MSKKSGQGGSILIDGTHTVRVTSWEAEDTTELDDVTDTGSAGWGEDLPTIRRLTGNVAGKWDSDMNPIATAGLVAQAEVTLRLNMGTTGKFYQCTALITSTPVTNPAKGGITFGFSFKSQGAVTMPAA